MHWPFLSVLFSILVFLGSHQTFYTLADTNDGSLQFRTEHSIRVRQVSNDGIKDGSSRTDNQTENKININSTETIQLPAEGNRTKPLDDLSLDDVPMLVHTHGTSSFPTTPLAVNVTSHSTTCSEDSKTYKVGDKFGRGCNEWCECTSNGQILCQDRCKGPLQRKGSGPKDEFCRELPTEDECCVIVQCTTRDTEKEPVEGCVHKNQSFRRGEMFNDGCEAVCSCESGGKVHCKPRCPPIANNSSSEQCVRVPDPADPCCTVVLCDVTLGDQDVSKTGSEDGSADFQLRLKSADALNTTSVIIHFLGEPELESNLTAEVSKDQKKWNITELDGVMVHNLMPGETYFIRIISGGAVSNAVQITLPKNTPTLHETTTGLSSGKERANVSEATNASLREYCQFKGKNYTVGEEFNDGCISYCICTETGVDCSPIECPSEFGLDVLDPTCVEWETRPKDFNPVPPKCCPDKVKCLNNGSCTFMGEVFPNWADIPSKISGCEKRCYCEFGNVTCQNVCPQVPEVPPLELPCHPQQAALQHLPGDDCCLIWVCPQIQHPGSVHHPHGFPGLPGQGHVMQTHDVVVQVLEPLDEHTVRMAFSVPSLLVGLHGRVEVRYTANKHEQDPSTWELQVLAPPGDLIATPQLHFDLGNLLPDTTYSIIIKIILRDLSNAPQSPILTVRTLPSSSPVTTLPPQLPIDPQLSVSEVNSTWARLTWRKFTRFELQFIDGVQIKYKEDGEKVFKDTPLIHKLVTTYILDGLRPNNTYKIELLLIPFPDQGTQLQAERGLEVQTTPDNDGYGFEINLDVLTTKSSSAEITWSGVPYPEDKYVNIYRVIYRSETGKEDYNSFKVVKRDSAPKIILTDLKPTTRYSVKLEAYLTNGRLKQSNSREFVTKPGTVQTSGPSFQGKLSGTPPTAEPGDYYGPLVAVAILAALAIMAALILLLVLMKKHGQNKASISSRTTQSAYDNPSYKTCESDRHASVPNGGGVNGTPTVTVNA